ncbi:polysaccharide deacetylase family protein [Pedobacter lusitanus]|uniref:polysaccharide deacetylase family protein n=1 Tax=Pedobacter lusitanus TaxID=1503925 RepID=UPI0009E444BE|nr:polysaccharide deacetylase family protein [Pedobacter lusitanus]
MKHYQLTICVLFALLSYACNQNPLENEISEKPDEKVFIHIIRPHGSSAPEIIRKKQIPILCYHQIRKLKKTDSKRSLNDIISPEKFSEHIKLLADSGYHTILPDELYNYLLFGRKLPENPIMITFDDAHKEHYTVAARELTKYNFKGVFFIITSMIGKRKSLNRNQIKELSDHGHAIENHTRTHKNFADFTDNDWNDQIDGPAKELENIIGKSVGYLAFPYGVINAEQLPELKKHHLKASFILSTRRDRNYPLFTLRRMVDPGNSSIKGFLFRLKKNF